MDTCGAFEDGRGRGELNGAGCEAQGLSGYRQHTITDIVESVRQRDTTVQCGWACHMVLE